MPQLTTVTSDAPLRPGEVVRVRSQDEILGTLDRDGRCEHLPFMPEMLPYCDRTMRVYKRAFKTCNSIYAPPGIYRMNDAVFLWGARCDGSAHGGCQAGCLFFWKEAWLERRATDGPDGSAGQDGSVATVSTGAGAAKEDRAGGGAPPADPAPAHAGASCTVDDVVRASRVQGDGEADTYVCQATEIGRATTPMPATRWWDLRQYGEDLRSGNAGIARVAEVLARDLAASLRFRLRKLPFAKRWTQWRGPTPPGSTLLQPGDRVRVRSRAEIEATLDETRRNRGLSFYSEMRRYCGGEFRVLRSVERIINEGSGQITHLTDCYVLDDVICQGDFHQLCPRAVYPYWRSAWLRKLD